MKKTTSLDVAKLAGVSQSAVSMILNNSENVTFSEETIKKVFDAAKQLNYSTPKEKKTKKKNQNILALFTPTMSNPYYPMLTQAIEDAAYKRGYKLLIFNVQRNKHIELEYLDLLQNSSNIVGLIYIYSSFYPNLIKEISEEIPSILIGENDPSIMLDTIGLNSYKAGVMITKHLIEQRRSKLGLITTPINQFTQSRKQRLKGIRDTLKEYNLSDLYSIESYDKEMETNESTYEIHAGYTLTKKLIQKNVDAIIGINDMTAFGILKALNEEGIKVPNEIAVCGFDNLFISDIMYPSLTTIDHCLSHRAKVGLDLLIEKILSNNNKVTNNVYRIEYEPVLIVRNSSK